MNKARGALIAGMVAWPTVVFGGDLCSSVASKVTWADYQCNTVLIGSGAPFTRNVRWELKPQYSTRLCSPKYNGATVEVNDAGSGVCGLGGVGSSPSFFETVDLVGSGSNWNTYQHKWIGHIQDISMNALNVPGNWSNHSTQAYYFPARQCEPCPEMCGPVCLECATCACPGGALCLPNGYGIKVPVCGATCSPIVVDPFDRGFRLTSVENGVMFRAKADSVAYRMSWTDPDGLNGWLALDRNGNGTVDDLTELFGNLTEQPETSEKNGFVALSQFDLSSGGGNENGIIDSGDAIFPSLRVWFDRNQDGVSTIDELATLTEVGIVKLDLKYKKSPYSDVFGNEFRFRGSIWQAGEKKRDACYDVFLQSAPNISKGH